MKISHKLVGNFVGVSLLTGVVGAVAIAQSQKIAENMAISETEHVAQVVAASVSHDQSKYLELIGVSNTTEIQDFINELHKAQNRQIVVLNRQRQIVADTIPENVGTIFNDDKGNEIQQTMQDGKLRTFLEQNVDDHQGIKYQRGMKYHQRIKSIVLALKTNDNQINGAIVLEWSSLYDEAIAQIRPTIVIINVTSIGCIILALMIGLKISRSIAIPLQLVTAVAQRVTQESNFDLQAPVISKDETGILATAFNNLIERVKTLLTEKEQVITELHNTQLQLVQTEKMSSLGQLVAGVAHEINNPIGFIHGNIAYIDNYSQDLLKLVQAYQAHYPNPPQSLQKTLDEVELDFLSEDLLKALQSMKIGTERIREIVLSLRNFSRLDEAEFKAVELHQGIDNTLLILQHRLQGTSASSPIEVVKDYSELPLVECYAGQVNQVFMNLLANAIDALQELAPQTQSGRIWISTQVTADDSVQIAIADNGSGIPEKVRSRIFDPFFTTKPVGKGTGLGLSISYQIVTEKHHGKMWCDSQPGQGSKFVIEIPVHQSKAMPS